MSYIGTTKVGGVYLGGTKIAKAYLGSDLVYQGQSGGIVLPSGYTLLNYINGNKRASGNFSISVPYDVEALVRPMSLGSYVVLGYNSNLQLGFNSSGKAYVGNASSTNTFFSVGVDALIEASFRSSSSESRYLVDGVDTGLHRATNTNNFNIFSASGMVDAADCNVYYIKISRNGELIKHWIPCLNANNTPVFYDIINNAVCTLRNASEALYG